MPLLLLYIIIIYYYYIIVFFKKLKFLVKQMIVNYYIQGDVLLTWFFRFSLND